MKGIKTRFSLCLRGADKKPWYATCPCELIRISGVDLAIHNSVKDNAVLELDPNAWSASDPLTGRQMFFSAPGDSKDEFLQLITHTSVPEIENHFKCSFERAVDMQRSNGLTMGIGPAPHPSTLHGHMSLPIIIKQ